jgi:hypothetical protein
MVEIFWIAVWTALAAVGVVVLARGRSRAWLIAGAAYLVSGIGLGVGTAVVAVTDAYGPPIDFTAVDVAVAFWIVGLVAVFAAMVATLVAIGRSGRRRFVIVFAATTLVVGTYEFWTSNWAARTAGATQRCADTQIALPSAARIQRVPPGVQCSYDDGDVFVAADGICWLALAGWSIFWALLASYPIMGVGWAVRRRPVLRPA